MKSSSLFEKINQITKKYDQSEKNKNTNRVRSSFKPLESTLRLVNPFSVFKVFTSGMMKETDHTIFPAISVCNYFKTVVQVSHDKKNKNIKIALENEPSTRGVHWEEIIDKLESRGDFYTQEWAKVLESYFESTEEIKKNLSGAIQNGKSIDFGMTKEEFDKLKEMVHKNAIAFSLKTTLSETGETEFSYTERMIQYLNYDLEQFCSDILAYGVPEIYPNSQRKYGARVRELLTQIGSPDYDGSPFESESELLHADFTTTFVKETIYTFRSVNIKGEIEYEMLMHFEHLSTPPPHRKPTVVSEFTSLGRFGYQAPDVDKERETFLEKFYNIKKEKPRDESKVCKIRFLDQ